ncbi:acetyl-CoA carboxylase carboxyl transferase subunit beta [Tamaricihabitans halophyticus]|uniref:Acetyl-coenzyme A carboxylase carboxyl transferase subunits beta/alpha n=1 Tax=Tamaricihabitans halophyticus TaxID=1262583 RepID=A0A4R2QA27_9PSEU|nr:carboxyl transferase domain-containing protein [Tamaricihabitans halophyticus]TCP45752.1 acetyl-CoA carboxylase carboxyl transferase subunit beta [Tamaricihabitans halophyticus]
MAEPARAVIDRVASSFVEFATDQVTVSTTDGPIEWPGYSRALAEAADRTGERESVVCGVGDIGGTRTVVIAFEFGFLGGSVGGETGNRIAAAFRAARELRAPVVSLVATGGSRMQEGMRALSQLQRIARESALTRQAGLPQLAVLRDPTTGGGWATLGAGADVTLALTGAQVGFAGSRVRPEGDPTAYTAEGQLAGGHVDQIVTPESLGAAVTRWVRLLTRPASKAAPPPAALGHSTAPATGWAAVRAAREPSRPRAARYLDSYFAWRENLSGDRCGGVDAGVLCGIGFRHGEAVAYAAQCGTATLPAGFRTAARLVRLADRLSIPVLTLVDTNGAANDGMAERAGAGSAIAELFAAIAEAAVPVTSLVIGEGGSGGALAFASPEHTWVTPDSYFSVTSPEAATAILKRPEADVPAIANQLRLRPQDLVELGVARGIVRPDDT